MQMTTTLDAYNALFTADFSPCQRVDVTELCGLQLYIKRDDCLHETVSGNKFRKLKYPLKQIVAGDNKQLLRQKPTLITMGGLWSNHLHASAFAAYKLGMNSVGLVRAHPTMSSATLDDCARFGMRFEYINREQYRQLREQKDAWQSFIAPTITNPFWLPEGGRDPAALLGVAEVIKELDTQLPQPVTTIIVACATATTLAGLLVGLQGRGLVHGIAVVNNAQQLSANVAQLLALGGHPNYQNFVIHDQFQQGGYAKTTPELLQFCADFIAQTAVPIEPIYTGKVFFALSHLVRSGVINNNQQVVVLHTGGMQGARGKK